jgi:hypothetical protein
MFGDFFHEMASFECCPAFESKSNFAGARAAEPASSARVPLYIFRPGKPKSLSLRIKFSAENKSAPEHIPYVCYYDARS